MPQCSNHVGMQTVEHREKARQLKILTELGFIKGYTYDLGFENNWTVQDFKLEKSELRKRYSVARIEPPEQILNKTSDEMLMYLRENPHIDQNYYHFN